MRKRLAMAVVVLALTACVAVLCERPGSSITCDTYQRIQTGMTRRQVEAILGGPPRNESGYAELHLDHHGCMLPAGWVIEKWWGPEIAIYITFDAQAKVASKEFEAFEACEPAMNHFLRLMVNMPLAKQSAGPIAKNAIRCKVIVQQKAMA